MERTGKTGSRAGGEVGQGSRGVSSEHEADMYVLPREYRGSIDSSRKSREWDRKEYILITPLTMTMTMTMTIEDRHNRSRRSKQQQQQHYVQRSTLALPAPRHEAACALHIRRHTRHTYPHIPSHTLTYLNTSQLHHPVTSPPHPRPATILHPPQPAPLLSSPLLAHSLPRVALTHCTTLFLSYIHPTRRDPRKSSRQTPITRVLSFPLPLWHTIIIPYHTLFVLSFRS